MEILFIVLIILMVLTITGVIFYLIVCNKRITEENKKYSNYEAKTDDSKEHISPFFAISSFIDNAFSSLNDYGNNFSNDDCGVSSSSDDCGSSSD